MKQRGRRMRSRVMGTPPHTSLICAEKLIPKSSLPFTFGWRCAYFLHFLPPLFSVCWVCFQLHRHCTKPGSVSHTPGNTSVHNIKAKKNTEKKALGRTFPSNIVCAFSKLLCLPSQGWALQFHADNYVSATLLCTPSFKNIDRKWEAPISGITF